MVLDYYLSLIFAAKQETTYLIFGLLFNLIGIPGLIEGIRGVRSGRIFLLLKRYRSEEQDTRTGVSARLWGVFYIVLNLIIIGSGSMLIWVFIASFFKR